MWEGLQPRRFSLRSPERFAAIGAKSVGAEAPPTKDFGLSLPSRRAAVSSLTPQIAAAALPAPNSAPNSSLQAACSERCSELHPPSCRLHTAAVSAQPPGCGLKLAALRQRRSSHPLRVTASNAGQEQAGKSSNRPSPVPKLARRPSPA
ncbi:DUF6053 domain-containing protein [Lysobacter capsici]|uniref:DUF6053 domain-containing protein n=1 Tax=Lysobacter capsici TaxID=435897 RepID=UPI003D2F62CD